MNEWQQAIDSELINCFLGTTDTPAYKDPRKALLAIIDWHIEVVLNPAVSLAARQLIERGRIIEREENVNNNI